MKKYIFLLSLILILFCACVQPEPEFEGTWLETLIYHAENGTDTTYTQAIFSYEYHGQPVYYLLSWAGMDKNGVYDTSGIKLGAPDGGYYQTGDGRLTDFFETATGGEMIWHYDFPTVPGAGDEYQIYNAALSCRFQGEDYLHVQLETEGETSTFYYLDRLETIDYDSLMIGDYLVRNMQELNLDTIWMIDPVVTVERRVLDAIWDHYDYPADWQTYYNQYPESNGIITLSRPGYSSDGKTAVMKLGWQISGDGGHGYMFVLKKYDDVWLIRYSFYTWVS